MHPCAETDSLVHWFQETPSDLRCILHHLVHGMVQICTIWCMRGSFPRLTCGVFYTIWCIGSTVVILREMKQSKR